MKLYWLAILFIISSLLIQQINAACVGGTGNGVVESGEACDGGALNGGSGYCCSTTCTIPCSWGGTRTTQPDVVPAGGGSLIIATQMYTGLSSSCSTTNLRWFDDTAGLATPCTGYTLSNTASYITETVTFPAVVTTTTCSMLFRPSTICQPSSFFSAGLVMSIQRTGTCGNSVINSGETCDRGAGNGATGSCCSSTCTLNSFTAGTPSALSVANCNSNGIAISSWFPSPTVTSTYWSSVTRTSDTCTGTQTITGGVTGNVNFPAITTPQTCTVTLQATTVCGQTLSKTASVTRYCCGDGTVTAGTPEVCDQGGNNGATGSCCSSTCTNNAFTSTTPSSLTLPNCAGTASTAVSGWFPSPSISSTYWSSVTITSETCTGTLTITGGVTGTVNFPNQPTGETCTVTLQITTLCGNTLSQTRTILRTCCGDGIVSSGETCDLGGNNSATSCCSTSCTSIAFTASAPGTQTFANSISVNLPVTNWFVSPTVTSAYWSSVVLTAETCTDTPTVVGTNAIFPALLTGQTCTTTLRATDFCGNQVTNIGTVVRTVCGDGSITGTETCDQGANNGVLGYCCPTNCSSAGFTMSTGTPSSLTLPNCALTTTSTYGWIPLNNFNLSISSVSIQSTTCTGSLSTTTTLVTFPLLSGGVGETCTVTLLFTSTCGQTTTSTRTIVRTCCGNGVTESGEQCDGGTCCLGNCTFAPASQQCRASAGVCDIAEFCSGSSSTCPANSLSSSSVQCFTAPGQCYVNRTCDGINPTCPSGFSSLGASCDLDSSLCTPDTCDGAGTCTAGSLISYDDGQYCNGVETCNPLTGSLVPGTAPNCDDGNSCTDDGCSNILAACTHTAVVGTTGSCGLSNVGACQYGTKSCDGSGPSPVVTCVGNIDPTTETCLPVPIDTNCNGVVGDGCTGFCNNNTDCDYLNRTQCQDVLCDTGINQCYTVSKTNGTSCNDGFACTVSDECVSGNCVGTPVVCNDHNDCTLDSCSEPSGVCVHNGAAMYQSPCNADFNLCSVGDACDNQGNCVAGTLTLCPSLGQCTSNVCDPYTGLCVSEDLFGECIDGSACTLNDACMCGECSGQPVDCNDFIECTEDLCVEPGGVCSHNIMPNHCYIDHQCFTFLDVNPNNPCQICHPGESTTQWTFTHLANVSCDDVNACTYNDICIAGIEVCRGTYIDCSYLDDQCQHGVCDTTNGTCHTVNHNEGGSCEDGRYCTIGDTCHLGECRPGSYKDCSSLDTDCVYHLCDENTDSCAAYTVADGTRCYLNNDICDGTESCQSGVCVHGSNALTCPSDDQCSTWSCNSHAGCLRTSLTGTACNDGNTCTFDGTCGNNYVCNPNSVRFNCNDGNKATADYCDGGLGCLHTNLSSTGFCNTADDCSPSACKTVSCVAHTCTYASVSNGTLCNDESLCNGIETCLGGVCVSGTPLTCNDNNECTDDFCMTESGCLFVPNDSNIPTSVIDDPCKTNQQCLNGTVTYDEVVVPDPTSCAFYICEPLPSDPAQYQFAIIPINEGSACNDGVACTINDRCIKGECRGDDLICPFPDQCQISVSCQLGICVSAPKANNTPCDSHNYCYENICNGEGDCINGASLVTCSPIDQCHDAGECIPELGICTTPPKTDGTPCDDGDPCTQTDTCQLGQCVGSDPVECTDFGECSLQGTCDSNTGLCVYPDAASGTFCTDNEECTLGDRCDGSGSCVACGNLVCPIDNPCISYSCIGDNDCDTPVYVTDPCDDGSLCTIDTVCTAGECPSGSGTFIDCPASVTGCGALMCSPQTGCMESPANVCEPCVVDGDCSNLPCKQAHCGANNTCYYTDDDSNVAGCLDSIYCNGQETCYHGVCISGVPPTCDDDNECTYDLCDYGLNTCTHTPTPNNTCFNHPNKCAVEAVCSNTGTCEPVTYVQCSPTPVCHYFIGCDTDTGQCGYDILPEGTGCDDGNACTLDDHCNAHGRCVGTSPLQCEPLDECHAAGTCDPDSGDCSNPALPDGTPCDDGFFCTIGDRCQAGACTNTTARACDFVPYDEQCQTVSCDEGSSSCQVSNVADGTVCVLGYPKGPCSNTNDVCLSGSCTRSYQVGLLCRAADSSGCDTAEHCVDGNDFCPPDVKIADGTTCSGPNFCELYQCTGGLCLAAADRNCSYLDDNTHVGFCDDTLNACVAMHVPDGTPCVTGNPIGQCVAFEVVINGVCRTFYKPSTETCDDNNACTINDHCTGNGDVCIGEPKDCTYLNTLCKEGICNDTLTGDCLQVSLHDGIACDADNNPCTVNDTCISGSCVAGPIKDCSYLDTLCRLGFCHTDTGLCDFNFVNDTCNDDYCEGGCTLTKSYWTNHNRYCSLCNRSRRFYPWPDDSELKVICGKTWYQYSQMRSKGSAWRKLMDQWLAAELNVLNGTCAPLYVLDILEEAHNLLLECQVQLSVYSPDAQQYKDYAAILESYNSGLIGPGHCESEACVNITSEFDTAACAIPTGSFYRAIIEDDLTACDNGNYDWATDTCVCNFGWSGPYCDECASPSRNDTIFICVPTRIPNIPYLLREIPINKLIHYMGPSPSPFTNIYHFPPTFPNTNGLDCFCQALFETTGSTALTRAHATRDEQDVVLLHTNNQDLLGYATMLQEDLGICEATWSVPNSFNISSMPDLAVSVHVDTTDDDSLEDFYRIGFYVGLALLAIFVSWSIAIIFPTPKHKLVKHHDR